MKIKSVQFKNFASYGNRVQTIEFDNDKSNLYLVLGANGSGKSSLAKVITYLCYGRIEGSNLKDLPNRVNGNLWGKIKLESRGNNIEIERGISPNIFKVLINGTEYDVAGKSNLQEFLETEIFEIPYHVFKNVIILSVNDFKSFITMSPFDKKQIIDRIFGFSVINQMRESVKQKRKIVIDEIRSLDDEIKTIEESINSVSLKLEQYQESSKERDSELITEFKEKLANLNISRKKIKDANDKLKEVIDNTSIQYKVKSKEEARLISEIKSIETGLTLYENNSCPTCSSPLNSDFHLHIKKEKEESLEVLQKNLNSIKIEINDIDLKITELREKGKSVLVKLNQIENKMSQFKKSILDLTNKEDNSSSHLRELIDEFTIKKEDKTGTKVKIDSEFYYLNILENILGDDGIKNLAIKSILPTFNSNILLMSKEIGISFIIKFDDKFNCNIFHLGNEINPKTLSTGEKKKIDFIIIMALIKMIKLRFAGLNILFLDEIFSSIDADGVHHIIEILHKSIHNIGLNTFVINHTVLPSEYFDKKIEITKDAGFSEFIIDTIK